MKNPLRMCLSRWGVINATSPVAVFAKSRMARLQGLDEEKKPDESSAKSGTKRQDFLSRFLEAGEKDPAFMTPERVLSLTSANVFAGSDTTAITLRAIFYYLLKNPNKLETLRKDIAQAETDGLFTREDKLVRWTEANAIPYLGAVIKESLRIHPAAGLPLERVVPQGGATISGHYVPAGTIVGCSAWTIHRDRKIFGDDVDAFRPERWLENPVKAAEMNQVLFSFGAGARTCAGKNISYLELYKLVPAMLRTFDVSDIFLRGLVLRGGCATLTDLSQLQLAYPEREWHLDNRWFVKQSELYVRLTTRGITR
jgi:cytochrome P450